MVWPKGKRRDNESRKTKSLQLKKHKKKNKKNHKGKPNRTEIKHLFEGLRKSLSSISMHSDDSVSICENTVIEIDDAKTSVKNPTVAPIAGTSHSATKVKSNSILNQKRNKKQTLKNSVIKMRQKHNKQQTLTNSVIIVDDYKRERRLKKDNPTFECSTPIDNNKKTLQDLILSNFPNNNTSTAQNFNEEVENLTREINRDSYVTIDLTKGTINNSNSMSNTSGVKDNTVIDLDKLEDGECEITIESVNQSQANTTMSGDSDVTVIHMSRKKKEEKVHKYINRIANLDSSGRVLESVMKKIFTGCNMVRGASTLTTGGPAMMQLPAPQSAEDTYIKEVILRQGTSRNSIGSNIYNPERRAPVNGPRMVVIDGSNVAMESVPESGNGYTVNMEVNYERHGKGRVFSVKGLKICIDYFLKRGHVVKAFVPRFRCKHGKSTDPRMLDELERRGLVVYTPSREIQGRLVTSYDDRYIVQCAAEFDGIIVSGDNYRDLMRENPRWQRVIETQLLPFTWVEDMIMFPRDPLGRHGPTLEQFLKHSKVTPTLVLS